MLLKSWFPFQADAFKTTEKLSSFKKYNHYLFLILKWDSLRFPRAQALRLLTAHAPEVAPAQAVPAGSFVPAVSLSAQKNICSASKA